MPSDTKQAARSVLRDAAELVLIANCSPAARSITVEEEKGRNAVTCRRRRVESIKLRCDPADLQRNEVKRVFGAIQHSSRMRTIKRHRGSETEEGNSGYDKGKGQDGVPS